MRRPQRVLVALEIPLGGVGPKVEVGLLRMVLESRLEVLSVRRAVPIAPGPLKDRAVHAPLAALGHPSPLRVLVTLVGGVGVGMLLLDATLQALHRGSRSLLVTACAR